MLRNTTFRMGLFYNQIYVREFPLNMVVFNLFNTSKRRAKCAHSHRFLPMKRSDEGVQTVG